MASDRTEWKSDTEELGDSVSFESRLYRAPFPLSPEGLRWRLAFGPMPRSAVVPVPLPGGSLPSHLASGADVK